MKKLTMPTLLSLLLIATIANLPIRANEEENDNPFSSLEIRTTSDVDISADIETIDGSFLVDETLEASEVYLDLLINKQGIDIDLDHDLTYGYSFNVSLNLVIDEDVYDVYLEEAIPMNIPGF